MSLYPLLFSPIALGPARVRNRVVFSAHLTNYAQDNLPGERLTAYYRERARGGAGLIIIEEQSVHPSDFAYEKLIHAHDPAVVPRYRRLTAAVKAEGAAVFCQINHNGGQGFSFFNDEPLWGPSPVEDGLFREIPQAIDEGQIAQVIAGYRTVAGHAREGGFDGVELQASHSSILRQFLSPHTNRREDRWGGSLENRLRLTVACLEAARAGAGPGLAVGIRLCTDELVDGGLELDAVVEVARRLEAAGLVDFINTSIGTTARLYLVEGSMAVPAGYQSAHTAAVRQAVRVPVIGVGRINDPVAAERLLSEGVADLVGIVRGQIADPEWAEKSRLGLASDIRKCIACNQYCIGLMGLNAPLSCIQNPANGQEAELGAARYRPTERAQRIWVVGAGPAGMEAALVLARHGHRVTLFDRAPVTGGLVNTLVRVPSRLEFGDLVRNKTGEVKRAGVELRLGVEVTAEMILGAPRNEAPEAVVLATGAEETRPLHIPGMDGPRVRTPQQVLTGPRPVLRHALVLDDHGGHPAAGLVEYLATGGARVTMVTSAFHAGQHLGVTLDLELWHARLAPFEVAFFPGHIVLDVREDPLLLDIYSERQTRLEGVDLIVPVSHPHSPVGMWQALQAAGLTVLRVGDALAPKDVGEAILDGHRAARQLCGVEQGWR